MGGIVEKQLAMDEKLNTLITNQANIEMVQGGLVNTVTLSLALSRMEGKLQTVDTTVQTINYDGVAPTVQTIDTEVGYIYDYFCGATGFNGPLPKDIRTPVDRLRACSRGTLRA